MGDRAKYDKTLARQRQECELRSRTPYPERITSALDLHCLYGPEVDKALGAEEPTVDLWESGELVPTFEQVQLLAELTCTPVGFFYKEPPGWHMGTTWVCGAGPCEAVAPKRVSGPPVPPEDQIAPVVAFRRSR